MKPATNTLSEIFQPPIRLMVPLYQRPYVWKLDDHWQPLWEDVEGILDRHLDGDGDSVRHFLGAIVLDQQYTPPGGGVTTPGYRWPTTADHIAAFDCRSRSERRARRYRSAGAPPQEAHRERSRSRDGGRNVQGMADQHGPGGIP